MKPGVSVVISTRDRQACVGRVIRSALRNEGEAFDLTVIELNRNSQATSLVPLPNDPRLRLMRTSAVATTRAHNQAIARTSGELVAVTDDDCEVSSDWIETLRAAFDHDPQIGVVFGNVYPAQHDRQVGSAPAYVRKVDFLARDPRDKAKVEGIWACMAFRRETWETVGGFDERLGSGATFPGSADSDFALRALAAGYFVYETPSVSVVHHRISPPEQRRELAHRYSYAAGAMMIKHLKCRTDHISQLLAALASKWFHGRTHGAMSLGGDTYRGTRFAAFLQGALAGAITPVDKTVKRYIPVDRGTIE